MRVRRVVVVSVQGSLACHIEESVTSDSTCDKFSGDKRECVFGMA